MSFMKINGFVSAQVWGVNKKLGLSQHVPRALLSVKGGATDADESKPFYALGVNIARQVGGELKGILTPAELDSMIKGFSDSILDKAGDERALLQTYGPKLNELLTSRQGRLLEAEKKKGADFITSYLLKNPRAIKTASGLIFNELIAGIGKQASPTSTVMVHYHGTLPDGTVFDSSVARGEPIKFPLGQVIRGWQEGVARMRAGGKAVLVVPSDLAYGDNGSPPTIPGGATLQFEVELIEVL